MSTGELYAISIQHGPELGRCWCTDPACKFTETATGHSGVMNMQAHAAQHAMTTGHQVDESSETAMSVLPLAARG